MSYDLLIPQVPFFYMIWTFIIEIVRGAITSELFSLDFKIYLKSTLKILLSDLELDTSLYLFHKITGSLILK